jgi:hypothetical protein
MEFETKKDYESTEFLGENEIDEHYIKSCSLICLLSNKNLSPTSIIISFIQNQELRKIMCDIMDITYYDFVRKMSYNYDIVNRSKKILYALNQSNDRKRKTDLQ